MSKAMPWPACLISTHGLRGNSCPMTPGTTATSWQQLPDDDCFGKGRAGQIRPINSLLRLEPLVGQTRSVTVLHAIHTACGGRRSAARRAMAGY